MNIIFVKKKALYVSAMIVLLAACTIVYFARERSMSTAAFPGTGERTVHLVTGEFGSKLPDGKEIEAYRWDPGTVYVRKGEKIHLSIYGVNGESHPFLIEGLNVRGEVRKGKETIVTFKAEKEGIYRIICLTHPDIAHNGPMVGYIVVED
ncbi:cupredoxin domain-containing protein [Paenibacillus hamazuiensis]|uniref:cupredoxin domain-containing protein n=1 Tax=Paenibacillus hamazuiensis TaxID=2936508 RepID=UPI00200D9ECC|nr:cupredoxin domain-containing protein [Paenibacillus hamazuiensis]